MAKTRKYTFGKGVGLFSDNNELKPMSKDDNVELVSGHKYFEEICSVLEKKGDTEEDQRLSKGQRVPLGNVSLEYLSEDLEEIKPAPARPAENSVPLASEFVKVSSAEDVGRILLEARKRAGKTQVEVAQSMGVVDSNVRRIEGGDNVTLKTLDRYAAAVGVEIEIRAVPR